jgi:hypothetical protein
MMDGLLIKCPCPWDGNPVSFALSSRGPLVLLHKKTCTRTAPLVNIPQWCIDAVGEEPLGTDRHSEHASQEGITQCYALYTIILPFRVKIVVLWL